MQEREDRKAHVKEMEHARNEIGFKTSVRCFPLRCWRSNILCISACQLVFLYQHGRPGQRCLNSQIKLLSVSGWADLLHHVRLQRWSTMYLLKPIPAGTGQEPSWEGFRHASFCGKQAHGFAQGAQWCNAVRPLDLHSTGGERLQEHGLLRVLSECGCGFIKIRCPACTLCALNKIIASHA